MRYLRDWSLNRYSDSYWIVFFLIILSFASWGRLLFLEGIWVDDWAWVWQYFRTDSYSQFIYPYQSLGHTLEGYITYHLFNLFQYFKEDTTWIFNILSFIFFTLNGLLIFLIFKNIMRHKTMLPHTIGALYMVSPLVNILCIVQINRTIFLFAFLMSFLLTVKSINSRRFKVFYYIVSIILSAFAITGLESFIFIEIFRPVMIYYIISKKADFNKIKTVLLYWSPYILIGTGILLYTMLKPQFGPSQLIYHPKGMFTLSGLFLIINRYVNSIYMLFIGIYKHNILLTVLKGDRLTLVLSIFASFTTSLLLLKSQVNDKDSDSIIIEIKWIMIFGLILTLAAIFPYAVTRDSIGNSIQSRHAFLANMWCLIRIFKIKMS
ncbi:MAG: hypothetical protein HQK93_09350 [Nitrospirae bacterium]|nr:hypothetical protein [Nitrospirota bacterium]